MLVVKQVVFQLVAVERPVHQGRLARRALLVPSRQTVGGQHRVVVGVEVLPARQRSVRLAELGEPLAVVVEVAELERVQTAELVEPVAAEKFA